MKRKQSLEDLTHTDIRSRTTATTRCSSRSLCSSVDRFVTNPGGDTIFDARYKRREDIPTYDVALFQVCSDLFWHLCLRGWRPTFDVNVT